jgi:hypothetical protein
MPHTKRASKRKGRKEAVPAVGVVGVVSLLGGASARTSGSAADIASRDIAPASWFIRSSWSVHPPAPANNLPNQEAAAPAETAAPADACAEKAAAEAEKPMGEFSPERFRRSWEQ